MAQMTKNLHEAQAPPRVAIRGLALSLLLALFVLVGAAFAVATPLFEVSDELWHYPMVKTLADGNGLPVQDPANPGPWRQEGSQPPLYYALMALATGWIDTSDMEAVRWVNPHADNGVITADGNNNIVIHTFREAWPWHGTVLAVRLIRLLSVLLGAMTVYFTYRLALEVLPGQTGLALAAAAFTAFTPMFVFVSASVNNDNLAIALSAAALWLMARWLRQSSPRPWWEYGVMGLLLGGAALSKVSALGLWPLAGAVMGWKEFRRRTNDEGRKQLPPSQLLNAQFRIGPTASAARQKGFSTDDVRPSSFVVRLLVQAAIVFGIAVSTTAWWFLRNYQLYGDWLGWNAFLATVGARPQPATLAQLWGERVGFVQVYWGLFGGVSVPMPDWTYLVLNVIAALATAGLAWAGARALTARKVDLTQLALWALLLGWVALIFVGLIRWTSLTWASQGRLIFPAISAIGVLAVYGLARLWRGLPWLAVSFMGALTAVVPWAVLAPHYAPPPALSAQQIGAIQHPVNDGEGLSFSGEMQLLGYDLATPTAQPGQALELTLYWQALIPMDRNWSIFVHVVDEAGVIVAQRDRYPGAGSLATTLLEPGQTFADHYVIPIPEAAYAPVPAELVVGLYDLTDGARLPLPDGSEAFTLGTVSIAGRPALEHSQAGLVPNPWRQNFANQIELTGYSMDRRSLRPGETLTLTLYWQALDEIPLNYSVFAHVRGEGETLWAGQDAWPQDGAAPTSTWRRGDMIVDTYELTLAADTPPGQHQVEVGLYDGETLERLQVIADDGRPSDADFVFLSPIRVVGP
jgi:hypothetical protein